MPSDCLIRQTPKNMWTPSCGWVFMASIRTRHISQTTTKVLRRSPFFYRENNEPVFQKGAVVATYHYTGGAFEQHAGHDPIAWTERKTASDERHSFEETRRDTEFIYLNDSSRGYAIRLPMAGGESALSGDGEKTWTTLYPVAQKKD